MCHQGQLNLVETEATFDPESLRLTLFASSKLQKLQRRGQSGDPRRQRGVSVTPHLWHRLGDTVFAREDLERLDLASSACP